MSPRRLGRGLAVRALFNLLSPNSSWPGLTRPSASSARDPRIGARLSPRLSGDGIEASLRLLQFHLGASLFELGLDLVGLVLVHAFLDRLRRAFDEVLGFLQAQAGDRTDFLDDLDLLVAGGGQHNRELGLFFS